MRLHATVSKDGYKLRTRRHPSRRIAVAEWRPQCPQDEDRILLSVRAVTTIHGVKISFALDEVSPGRGPPEITYILPPTTTAPRP